jgi:HJR/Mrr/RecB family endonuclease
MQKPTAADFQVSETALDDAKRIRHVLVILALAWMVVAFGIFAYIGREKAWPLLILAVPPYGPVIFYYAAKAAARRLIPAFGRALAYEAAVERYQQWWLRTQSDFWSRLSGRAFEAELANLYRRMGFNPELTSRDTDKGVDIWITKDGHRIPVQCKAHRRPVTPGAVRELYGTMQHFGVHAGILASVSGFTRGVSQYARGKGIELVDLRTIIAFQRRFE